MKKVKRAAATIVALSLGIVTLSGCQGKNADSAKQSGQSVTFPLATSVTLKVWRPQIAGLISKYPDMSDYPIYKNFTKQTNIQFKVISPAVGQEKDQFNLMISSGDYPDIYDNGAISGYYSGGFDKAYADGLILKLNDLQKKYAPDLQKIYNEFPDINALMKNDEGLYLSTPLIRGDASMLSTAGYMVRQDWLTKSGLSSPVTMDDWHTMLTAFKDKMGATAPLIFNDLPGTLANGNGLIGAYGIAYGYFVEDGKMKYGPADSRYEQFLATFAQWYKEGLIDPEFATNNSQTFDSKVENGKSGAFFGGVGGAMGTYMKAMATKNPDFKLTGVSYPVLKQGESTHFSTYVNTRTNIAIPEDAISSKTKYPEVCMAFLNLGYTKSGYLTYNFGEEGTSYKVVDGYPTYTDLITKNPDGLSMANAIQLYARASTEGPFVQDPRYLEQYYNLPEQQAAVKTYAKNKLTPDTNPTPEGKLSADETNSISSSETQIQTYVDEQLLRFVTGVQPVNDSTFSTYVKQLKALGLDNDLQVRQKAEDRFKKNNPAYYAQKVSSSVYDLFKNATK